MIRRALIAAALALPLSGCVVAIGNRSPEAAPAAAVAVPPASAPVGYQYLYGSGEGSAIAMQAFHAMLAYAKEQVAHRPANSVVLMPDSPLVDGKFVPCGAKPFAVVFDVDETLLWNLGFEARAAAGEAYDQARWDRYEQSGGATTMAVPGAEHAVEDLRKMGVTVVFNTNRKAADATIAALTSAKLGPAVHGDTLFLQGDDGGGSAKDGRRATIAARYCVIAMVGDQLGDFSDKFNAIATVGERRLRAQHSSAGGLWGKGWFVLPNTAYGTALRGGIDDMFPAEKRWNDPAGDKK